MAFNFKIDSYASPIPGSRPSGEDLRYTTVYDEIKEAKREDDRLERGEWHTDLKRSDWELTAKLCGDALKDRSKDLQIAVWLTEALLHQHGFKGFKFGLQLLSKLLTEFWQTLYPQIEDDDLDFRAGPFAYMNEKLPTVVFQVSICDPDHTKGFSYFAWEESRLVGFDKGLDEEQQERRQKLIDEGKVSGEEFRSAVNLGSINFYTHLRNQLAECRDQLNVLDNIVTIQFSPDPPGIARLVDAVEACLRLVEKIFAEKQKSEVDPEADPEVESLPDPMNAGGFGPQLYENMQDNCSAQMDNDLEGAGDLFISSRNAISDITRSERAIWKKVAAMAGNGSFKSALDQLMVAAALAPSVRQKNRYLLLVAKLCLRAGRHDLARPIVEQLYALIETLKLEKWEHPAWIAEVIESLYRCLEHDSEGQKERAAQLFQKLCTLNITKAAMFRIEK
jgi:type VI secretion system protein ImpA